MQVVDDSCMAQGISYYVVDGQIRNLPRWMHFHAQIADDIMLHFQSSYLTFMLIGIGSGTPSLMASNMINIF